MDDAFELADYLPRSFKSASEQDYTEFLWESFFMNYEGEKYQFAFLSYHMLVMSFIYFEIWQIKENRPTEFEMVLIGLGGRDEEEVRRASSPFTLSLVPERTVLRFLSLIGCEKDRIGTYAKLVDDRNQTAHSNGVIQLQSEEALELQVRKALRAVKEIQRQSVAVVESCYRTFLLQNLDPEDWEYLDARELVQESLIYKNYFSNKDLEICRGLDIGELEITDSKYIDVVESIHAVLTEITDEAVA